MITKGEERNNNAGNKFKTVEIVVIVNNNAEGALKSKTVEVVVYAKHNGYLWNK